MQARWKRAFDLHLRIIIDSWSTQKYELCTHVALWDSTILINSLSNQTKSLNACAYTRSNRGTYTTQTWLAFLRVLFWVSSSGVSIDSSFIGWLIFPPLLVWDVSLPAMRDRRRWCNTFEFSCTHIPHSEDKINHHISPLLFRFRFPKTIKGVTFAGFLSRAFFCFPAVRFQKRIRLCFHCWEYQHLYFSIL